MAEREQRIAYNETLFRAANEQILAVRQDLRFEPAAETAFICECGDPACTSPLLLNLAEYQAVRRDPNTFFVVLGHEDPATETVVGNVIEANHRYAVVEKREHLRGDTEATNPRA